MLILDRGEVRVIAGAYDGTIGPARTCTPSTMLDAHLNVGGHLPVILPATYNALAVVTKGRVQAGEVSAHDGEVRGESHVRYALQWQRSSLSEFLASRTAPAAFDSDVALSVVGKWQQPRRPATKTQVRQSGILQEIVGPRSLSENSKCLPAW
jgi:hypothetical protein